jgi:hypothetical protein
VGEGERRHLGPPKAAGEQDGEDGAIAETPDSTDVGRVEKALRLARRQPVAHADSHGFGASHPGDSGGQLRREQPIVRRLRGGGELGQIQLLLGYASVQTTERYLGTRQDLVHAPNDAIRLRTAQVFADLVVL